MKSWLVKVALWALGLAFVITVSEWVLKQVVWLLVALVVLTAGGCVTAQDILETSHQYTLEGREGVDWHQWTGWKEF